MLREVVVGEVFKYFYLHSVLWDLEYTYLLNIWSCYNFSVTLGRDVFFVSIFSLVLESSPNFSELFRGGILFQLLSGVLIFIWGYWAFMIRSIFFFCENSYDDQSDKSISTDGMCIKDYWFDKFFFLPTTTKWESTKTFSRVTEDLSSGHYKVTRGFIFENNPYDELKVYFLMRLNDVLYDRQIAWTYYQHYRYKYGYINRISRTYIPNFWSERVGVKYFVKPLYTYKLKNIDELCFDHYFSTLPESRLIYKGIVFDKGYDGNYQDVMFHVNYNIIEAIRYSNLLFSNNYYLTEQYTVASELFTFFTVFYGYSSFVNRGVGWINFLFFGGLSAGVIWLTKRVIRDKGYFIYTYLIVSFILLLCLSSTLTFTSLYVIYYSIIYKDFYSYGLLGLFLLPILGGIGFSRLTKKSLEKRSLGLGMRKSYLSYYERRLNSSIMIWSQDFFKYPFFSYVYNFKITEKMISKPGMGLVSSYFISKSNYNSRELNSLSLDYWDRAHPKDEFGVYSVKLGGNKYANCYVNGAYSSLKIGISGLYELLSFNRYVLNRNFGSRFKVLVVFLEKLIWRNYYKKKIDK